MATWIHDQAMYTNVTSTGDSAKEVNKNLDEYVHFPLLGSIDVKPYLKLRQAQPGLSEWKETLRKIHKSGVSIRYSTSQR